jgi:hypothetical protein
VPPEGSHPLFTDPAETGINLGICLRSVGAHKKRNDCWEWHPWPPKLAESAAPIAPAAGCRRAFNAVQICNDDKGHVGPCNFLPSKAGWVIESRKHGIHRAEIWLCKMGMGGVHNEQRRYWAQLLHAYSLTLSAAPIAPAADFATAMRNKIIAGGFEGETPVGAARSYRESLLSGLRDPKEAIAYLTAAIEDSPEMYTKALSNVFASQVAAPITASYEPFNESGTMCPPSPEMVDSIEYVPPAAEVARTDTSALQGEGRNMRTIHKFELEPGVDREILLSACARVVHVAEQRTGWVTIWIENLPDAIPQLPRKYMIFGTGHPIPDEAKHVGSALCAQFGAQFVWHVYEEIV